MPDLRTGPKHLTLEERTEIQNCLFHGVTFKAIARRIGKDPTTVSKEVRKHIQVIPARIENAAPCSQLLKAPFVCNGCQRKRYCKLEKHEYLARPAHEAYRDTLFDADLCLKLKDAGYRNLFTPYARFRGGNAADYFLDHGRESKAYRTDGKTFRAKWKTILAKPDPCYNPNLTEKKGNYNVGKQPKI